MSATRSQSIPATATKHGPAVLAGFFGWTLDAFDYFLVVYCLTAIGRDFHQSDEAMALSLTVTLGFRPVGAFLFGLLADRYGRRLPLMLNLVFYSIVEVLSGLAPNYATFMFLRALFGIGMGGQWGVGASLAMEKVPPRIRGLLSGVLQQGYAAGNLLAGIAFFFLFDRVGWRPLFFLGGLPALLAVFVWYRVEESEVWQKSRAESWSHLFAAILKHWKVLTFMIVLMTCFNFVSHGTQDMYPTFLQRQWGFSARERAAMTAVSAVGAILGGTLFGMFSDRMGRRRAMITALMAAVVVIPIWAFAPSTGLLVAGAFLMQFMVQGAWGVIPAHLNELSPPAVRGTLPGFAYQIGNLLSSRNSVIQARVAELRYGGNFAPVLAWTVVIVASLVTIITWTGKERRGADLTKTT